MLGKRFLQIERVMPIVALIGLLALIAGPASAEETKGSLCDLGVTLALSGDTAQAESVFVSLLSSDPAALTNLGNIHLMNGDLEVALAFYEMAFKADPEDPGILLNRSVALMLMGEEEEAQAQAKEGIEMAGGMKDASSMLGIKMPESGQDESKGSDKVFVSKDEVGALLSAALLSVPADSAMSDSTAAAAKQKKKMAWRSAGARAADGAQVGQVLYWKR